jgi:hypothetical protein
MSIRVFTAREALKYSHELTTRCVCGSRTVDLEALIRAGHGDVEFPDLKRRLVCQGCHKRIWSMQVTVICDSKTGLPPYYPPRE